MWLPARHSRAVMYIKFSWRGGIWSKVFHSWPTSLGECSKKKIEEIMISELQFLLRLMKCDIVFHLYIPPTSIQWQRGRLVRHAGKIVGFIFNLVSVFLSTLSIMLNRRMGARYVKGLIHLWKCCVQRLIFFSTDG